MSAKAWDKFDDIETIHNEILEDFPHARDAWETTAPKRKIALMLARIRMDAGLTQSAVAERAGWDKAYVSRLESATGGMPDNSTIARFADACGAVVGIIAGHIVDNDRVYVVDAVTIDGSKHGAKPADEGAAASPRFESLREKALDLVE